MLSQTCGKTLHDKIANSMFNVGDIKEHLCKH